VARLQHFRFHSTNAENPPLKLIAGVVQTLTDLEVSITKACYPLSYCNYVTSNNDVFTSLKWLQNRETKKPPKLLRTAPHRKFEVLGASRAGRAHRERCPPGCPRPRRRAIRVWLHCTGRLFHPSREMKFKKKIVSGNPLRFGTSREYCTTVLTYCTVPYSTVV
jgi:hypothetical protein